jgi:hypothetical protein
MNRKIAISDVTPRAKAIGMPLKRKTRAINVTMLPVQRGLIIQSPD